VEEGNDTTTKSYSDDRASTEILSYHILSFNWIITVIQLQMQHVIVSIVYRFLRKVEEMR